MNVNPPPLPSSGQKLFRQLAQVSWGTLIVSFVYNFFFGGNNATSASRAFPLINAIFVSAFCLTGLVAGLVALCGVRRYGREGILWPAITGVGIWLLLFAIAIPAFTRARSRALAQRAALQPTKLEPAVHSLTAIQVEDHDIGFSFDLPEDYESFPSTAKPKGFSHAYLRQVPLEGNRLLLVKPMGGTLPRKRLKPQELPPGKTVFTLIWRGLEVDAVRVPEKSGNIDYVTFNIQIPLRKQAIQLTFAGPAEVESQVRALAERTLSTLEGETNW